MKFVAAAVLSLLPILANARAEAKPSESGATLAEAGHAWALDRAELPDVPPKLVALVAALVRLQDASATGTAPSSTIHRELLTDISEQLLSADPTQLPKPRVLRAAIIYTLSGGRPTDCSKLLLATPETDPLHWLLAGAMEFAQGRREKALAYLRPFDPDRLPASIGGRIALAEAMSLPEGASAERVRLLLMAARLMPGTLVEESARRRLVAIAEGLTDPLPLEQTAERYVRHFARSIYAGTFLENYARAVVRFEARGLPVGRSSIELFSKQLSLDQRTSLYTSIARKAALHGFADLTLFAASRARRIAVNSSDVWHVATLYDAAVQLVGSDYDVAMKLLQQVDASRLGPADRDLHAAISRLAEAIRHPTTAKGIGLEGKRERLLEGVQLELAGKVEKAIKSAEQLLKGPGP